MRGSFRGEITSALKRLKNELASDQQRRAVSRDVVFREYANGRVLFRGDKVREIINHYSPSANLSIALTGLINELKMLYDPETAGMTIAVTRNDENTQYVFVLVYTRP